MKAPVRLQRQYHVHAYECSPMGILPPHTLAGHLQQIASEHADSLGFGMQALKEKGYLWALPVLHIRFSRQPRVGEDFSIETWPSSLNRLRISREMLGLLPDGSPLFFAQTDWMALEAQSRRTVDLGLLPELRVTDPTRLGPDKLQRHKPGPPGKTLESLRVPLSALDANGHVNNTVYVRWAHDALYAEGYTSPPSAIRMTYHNESFLGDGILLDLSTQGTSCAIVGRRGADVVFSAVFDFAGQV